MSESILNVWDDDPTNGQVSFGATTFQSRANYSCSAGYILMGNMTRSCQADGGNFYLSSVLPSMAILTLDAWLKLRSSLPLVWTKGFSE